jgi:hypothetical protein
VADAYSCQADRGDDCSQYEVLVGTVGGQVGLNPTLPSLAVPEVGVQVIPAVLGRHDAGRDSIFSTNVWILTANTPRTIVHKGLKE